MKSLSDPKYSKKEEDTFNSLIYKKGVPNTEIYFDLSEITIPFSKLKKKNDRDIYSGSENISFNNRHPIFKKILLEEFFP
ncbi:MAG: hypothetical protein ACTSUL_02790 [Promethearchaeota archaeon]